MENFPLDMLHLNILKLFVFVVFLTKAIFPA